MTWNINGWTEANQLIRKTVIHLFNPDILCITETHLEKEQSIEVTGFKFIPHNRTIKHVKAPKIHGGIGLLVKNVLYDKYYITVIDKIHDGILGVKFVDKNTEQDFIIFTCYLAPYDSPYGRKESDFLGHLIVQLYLYNECSQVYICGDFNGRIGNLSDVVEGIDSLPSRNILDNVIHGHGEALIGFLQDAKLCTLNGRLSPENDNFTCISPKGISVVDYIIVPHDVFHKCKTFNVYTMTDIADMCNLAPLIGNRCKLPDHSLLHVNFSLEELSSSDNSINENVNDINTNINNVSNEYKSRRYHFNNVPEFFMSSESWKNGMMQIVDTFINCIHRQEEIDNAYNRFCNFLTSEMDHYLKYSDSSSRLRKKFKNYKPYWSEDLSFKWLNMSRSEKQFIKCKGSRQMKSVLRQNYANDRNIFDKALRKAERDFNNKTIKDIETSCTTNPREFWNFMANLGPRTKKDIPMKVYDDNNILVTDLDKVLESWQSQFQGLYNKPESENDPKDTNDFYNNILSKKRFREAEMEQPNYVQNPELNRPLSFDELEYMINKIKNNKSTGIDQIPNEVLKKHDVMLILFQLYTKCFDSGLVPSLWLKAVICPVPKSSTKDPFVPLNYRGISLLSCICKVYAQVLLTNVSWNTVNY